MSLLVDVVITNHDYDEFLPAAVESALAQSHSPVRVIVVDDGSTDRSRELLRRYDDRVDLILKPGGGQASALNAGVERCRGDVVIFLDADDLLQPHAAASVAAAFARHPDASKVQFRLEVIDRAGIPTGEVKPHRHMGMPDGDLASAELAFPFDIPTLPTSGNAFRLDVVRRISPVPERAYPTRGADWYLVHVAALLGPVVSLDQVCGCYRVHGRNGYEVEGTRLDLDHVRDSIAYAAATRRELERVADEAGLARPREILSMSDLGNRLIVRRLERVPGYRETDSIARLLVDAVRAADRRTDIGPGMKAALLAWFAATALAPRPFVRPLAELFLFPARREAFNRLREVTAR